MNLGVMGRSERDYVMFSKTWQYSAQEEMLEIKKSRHKLVIGIPLETAFDEHRIALAPEAAAFLTHHGHRVLIQSKAGENAFFSDEAYVDAGCELVYSAKEVYKADIILKVAPLSDTEIDLIQQGQVIFSTLALPIQKASYFKELIKKRVTAIAFEFIRDKGSTYPLVRSMSEIAGNTSILIAAEYLSNKRFGKGRMFGGLSGITPTEVVIMGAGTVGEYAARAAMGLGAMVKVFDQSVYKLRRLQNNLNVRLFSSIIQPRVLLKSLRTADVVIGAIYSPWGPTPVVISEDMVKQMKPGSVIVDVSIDQGGCIESSCVTTHSDPVYEKHGVTHYCVPNIASRIPNTASYAISNFFAPVLMSVGEEGGAEQVLKRDASLRQGVYIFNGTLTNQYVGEFFQLPYQDIDLLMAAF